MSAIPLTPTSAFEEHDGVELLAKTLVEHGLTTFHVVPGKPASALIDTLGSLGATIVDAHDEKSAMESAIGMSRYRMRGPTGRSAPSSC